MLCSSSRHLILTISSFSVKCELEKCYEQKIAMTRKDRRETMKRQLKEGNNATLKMVPKNIPALLIYQQSSHRITVFSISPRTAYYLLMSKRELEPRIEQNQCRFSISATSDCRSWGQGAGGQRVSPPLVPVPAGSWVHPRATDASLARQIHGLLLNDWISRGQSWIKGLPLL